MYRCVTAYCCFVRDISQSATCFGPMWAIIRKNHSYKRRIWHWYVSLCVSTNNCFSLYFHKNITCLSVDLLRAGQVFTVCCQTVCRCVTTYCCCIMDDILPLCSCWSRRYACKSKPVTSHIPLPFIITIFVNISLPQFLFVNTVRHSSVVSVVYLLLSPRNWS